MKSGPLYQVTEKNRQSIFSAEVRDGNIIISVVTWPPIKCSTCKGMAAFLVNHLGPDSKGHQCLNCAES